MFGYQGGESSDTVARKRGYMTEARALWPFLTAYDVTTIRNERHLTTMVRDRLSLSTSEADAVVHDWMDGKSF